MGGTVIGTSLGVGAGYLDRIYPRLRETTGLDLRPHPNFFDVFQNGDVFQYISTIFKALACGLIKIAKDLRLLSSGNRAGLGEITLPAVQAGSSFMPGKVNPVMAELVVQVGYQVCGNDSVVTMAVEGAELDFNAWTAVIAKNLLESAKLLTNAMPLFTDKCLRGLEVRADRTRATAANTLGLSTVVGGVYGYDAGARAAYHAAKNNTSIADAVVELGIASRATADRLLDPVVLTDGRASSVLLDQMVDEERKRTEALLAGLSPQVRHEMLAAAGAVARADSVVSAQEEHALAVVADALDITPDGRDPFSGVAELTPNERELVYSCAAWLASADSVTEAAESQLLSRFAEALELDEQTVSSVQDRITTLSAERRAYLPRSEQLPWWEEFGELVRRLITTGATVRG
jgi:aspartate ammonia-lyase